MLYAGGRSIALAQQTLGIDPPSRGLSQREQRELERVYYDSVRWDDVRIKEGVRGIFSLPPRVAAFVVGNTIHVMERAFTPGQPLELGLLVHEIAHVWQYQNGGLRYLSDALSCARALDGSTSAAGRVRDVQRRSVRRRAGVERPL